MKNSEPVTSNDRHYPFKLFSAGWITAATYLGGPLAGVYMLSKNFKRLKMKNEAESSWRIGLLLSIIFITGLIFVPQEALDFIPNSLFPILYTAIIAWYVHRSQNEKIQKFLDEGGKKESGWRILGIIILSIIISIAYFLTVGLLFIDFV